MLRGYALAVAIIGIILLLAPAAPAFAASGSDDGTAMAAGTPEKSEAAEPKTEATPAVPQQSKKKSRPDYKAEDWTVAIYPIFVWAPVMGGSINLPDLPPLPAHPVQPPTGGDVSSGLTGAAFFGFGVQKKWFVADVSLLWASFGATQDQPKISLDSSFLFYDATAGVKLHKDLSVSAGVRHLGMTLDATIADRPKATWKPGVTDPMIGVDYRHSFSKHWGVDLNFKGGGFGAGSDVDLSTTGRLDWRFARHFGATFGYGMLHFKITDQVTTSLGTYHREVNQTLNGPIFGFGIYF